MNRAINQNGICQIVSSGNFVETVLITNQVTIEAAPGVIANIEAFVVPMDPRLAEFPDATMDPFKAQGDPGIVINAPADRQVILRNLVVTNWTDGIRVMGNSHVIMDNVRVDHNVNNGVAVVGDGASVAIRNSQITSTGFRLNPRTGNFPTMMPPMPGIGVNVSSRSANVLIQDTLIIGNAGAATQGVNGATSNNNRNMIFDNDRARDLPSMP